MPRTRENKPPRPTDEQVRERILIFMYGKYIKSRAVNPGRLKISQIKKELKAQGLTEQEIVRNVDYLVQTKWIVREEENYPIMTGIQPVMASQQYFKISHKGVEYTAGPSKFQMIERYEGINVNAVSSVVVIGGNNVVNASYTDLYSALGTLSDSIKANDKLDDVKKLECQADIETIKSQLVKAQPDPTIVQRAWGGLKAVATLEGVVGAATRVGGLLLALFGF